MPHKCLSCDSSYAPYIDNSNDVDDEPVSCFLCEGPAHAACIKDTSISKKQGIVYICSSCYTDKGKSDALVIDETAKPKQQTDTESSTDTVAEKTLLPTAVVKKTVQINIKVTLIHSQ